MTTCNNVKKQIFEADWEDESHVWTYWACAWLRGERERKEVNDAYLNSNTNEGAEAAQMALLYLEGE